MEVKFNALQWAEDHLIFEESSTEINDGAKKRLADLLERAYQAGVADTEYEWRNRWTG